MMMSLIVNITWYQCNTNKTSIKRNWQKNNNSHNECTQHWQC